MRKTMTLLGVGIIYGLTSLVSPAFSGNICTEEFSKMDEYRNGRISKSQYANGWMNQIPFQERKRLMEKYGMSLSDMKEMIDGLTEKIWPSIDTDGSGDVSLKESCVREPFGD